MSDAVSSIAEEKHPCLHLDRRCKSWEACARRLAIDSAKRAETILEMVSRESLLAAGIDPDDREGMRARVPEASLALSKELGCEHGRLLGQPCPHCMGISGTPIVMNPSTVGDPNATPIVKLPGTYVSSVPKRGVTCTGCGKTDLTVFGGTVGTNETYCSAACMSRNRCTDDDQPRCAPCFACGKDNAYALSVDGNMYGCCEGSPACEAEIRRRVSETDPPERANRLNRTAFVKLTDENIAWLLKQPRTLEREHILATIIWAVGGLYEQPEPGPHDWVKSQGPQMERCTRCLCTRSISAGAMWEYFDWQGRSGFALRACDPPKNEPRGETARLDLTMLRNALVRCEEIRLKDERAIYRLACHDIKAMLRGMIERATPGDEPVRENAEPALKHLDESAIEFARKVVLENKDARCMRANRTGAYGVRIGDLLSRPTRPTTDEDHICRYCAETHPRACLCWTCEAKLRSKRLSEARRAERLKEQQAKRSAKAARFAEWRSASERFKQSERGGR